VGGEGGSANLSEDFEDIELESFLQLHNSNSRFALYEEIGNLFGDRIG